MKQADTDQLKAFGLLVFFLIIGSVGFLLAKENLGVWKDSGFRQDKNTMPLDIASARFFVVLGGIAVIVSAICVINLLRYDLRSKRRRK